MSDASRVLVVDDDPAFVKITSAILETEGYEVETASNATQALATIRESKPALLLLDVMMDGVLDGVEICREVANSRDLWGMPIIFVTSIRDTEYRSLFSQDEYLPVDAWLFKPCAPAALVAEVNRLLRPSEDEDGAA